MRKTGPPPTQGPVRVLLVEDDAEQRVMMRRWLSACSNALISEAADLPQARDLLMDGGPWGLIVSDVRLPSGTGLDVLSLTKSLSPGTQVLLISGHLDFEVACSAIQLDADAFLAKPLGRNTLVSQVEALLTRAAAEQARQQEAERVRTRMTEELDRHRQDLAKAQLEMLGRLAVTAEYRDDVTGRHSLRVGVLSALLADGLGLPDEVVSVLRRAAVLHDVGKVGIPDSILNKPGALTPDETEVMRTHTAIGGGILSGSRFPVIQMAREIALSHHERWDGRGYGAGLGGESIPLTGRIVAIADAFDCLTQRRPYRGPVPFLESVERIATDAGKHFDPAVVDVFLRLASSGALGRLDELAANDSTGFLGHLSAPGRREVTWA